MVDEPWGQFEPRNEAKARVEPSVPVTEAPPTEVTPPSPNDTTLKIPDPEIPAEAEIVERNAQGKPTVKEYQGERYFLPGSTPYESGHRKGSEQVEYGGRPFGIYEGSLVTPDSILLMEGDKPRQRITFAEIERGEADISDYAKRDAIRYSVTGAKKGETVLLSTSQVEKIRDAPNDKAKFDLYQRYGIIDPSAKYYTQTEIDAYKTGEGTKQAEAIRKVAQLEAEQERQANWDEQATKKFYEDNALLPDGQYISKADLASIKKDSPEVYEILHTKGFAAANAYVAKQDRLYEGQNKLYKALYEQHYRADILPEQKIPMWQNTLNYLKTQFISPDTSTQSELEGEYEAEQSAPLWAKLLFGNTLAKNSETGEYYRIIIGEAPGKIPPLPKVAPTTVKTVEINWNKLISPKVIKPQVNWNELTKAIDAGKIKSAADAAEWASAQAKWFPQTNLTPGSPKYQQWMKSLTEQGLKDAANSAAKARTLEMLKGTKVALIPQPNAPITQWRPFNPMLNKAKMADLIVDWQNMKASKAMPLIISANLMTFAVATNPEAINSILSKVDSNTKQKALSVLSPKIQQALQNNQLTEAQTLAQTQVKTTTQIQALTRQSLELAQELASQGKTATEIQELIQTKLQAQTKAIPKAQVGKQVRQSISTVLQTISLSLVKPQPARIPIPTPTPKPLLSKVSKERLEVDKVTRIPDGSVAWRQGTVWGKEQIKYIPPPYNQLKPLSLLGQKPLGWVDKGRTPKETIQMIGRPGAETPESVSVDLGIADILIRRVEGKYEIEFTGRGLQTVVGERLPGPTRGMSIPAIARSTIFRKGRSKRRSPIGSVVAQVAVSDWWKI